MKAIGGIALTIAITLVLAITKLTLPLSMIAGLSIVIFAGCLLSYQWQRQKTSVGRMILMSLLVAGVSSAILVCSRLLATR